MPDLTPEALDRLETLAKEATPGSWKVKVSPDGGIAIATDGFSFSQEERDGDAEYIAAAQPATILALIAEVRRLQRWKTEALPVMDGLHELGKALSIPLGKRITGPLAVEAVERLNTEVKQLRDELEGEPECPGCWVQTIAEILDGGDH